VAGPGSSQPEDILAHARLCGYMQNMPQYAATNQSIYQRIEILELTCNQLLLPHFSLIDVRQSLEHGL
jgi:hypothetical protein